LSRLTERFWISTCRTTRQSATDELEKPAGYSSAGFPNSIRSD